MELFGIPKHPSTVRAEAFAAFCGTEVAFKGADAPDGRKLPTLITPEGPLSGSGGVLRYLASTSSKAAEVYGATPFAQSQVDQWVDFVVAEVDPVLASLVYTPLGFLKAGSVPRAVEKESKAQMAKAIACVEARLGAAGTEFLCGAQATLADVVVGTALHFAALFGSMGPVIAKASTVAPYLERCRALPGVADALPGKEAAVADAAAGKGKQQKQQKPKQKQQQKGKKAGAGAGKGKAAEAAADAPAPVTTSVVAAGQAGGSTDPDVPQPALVPVIADTYSRGRLRVRELLGSDGGESRIGARVVVAGWVRTIRKQGQKLAFVELSDGSTAKSLQVVCNTNTTGLADLLDRCTTGASVRVEGEVVASPARGQKTELKATDARIVGVVTDSDKYPLAKKKHSLEFIRSHMHLRARTNTMACMHRIRNACAYSTHRFFQDRGFQYVHTPIVTTADCEGAGEMFGVSTMLPSDPKADLPRTTDGAIDYAQDFYGKPSFLTVSGQLNVETYCCALSDVYTFGPTFRAENSATNRHLSEFWMIEPEIAFADLKDDMALATDYLKYVCSFVLLNCADDLAYFQRAFPETSGDLVQRLETIAREPFVHLTYTEAVEIITSPEVLAKAKFEVVPAWGDDLGSEHERYLTEVIYKGLPVIVTDYPKDIKAFYMKLNPDGRTVAAMDILVAGIGEIVGGSQREEDVDVLYQRMDEMGLAREHMEWYAELRKYGTVPHAGFGLGFERMVMLCTGLNNIRDVIPFPRWPKHASF